jgi:uncharacterized membrane protein
MRGRHNGPAAPEGAWSGTTGQVTTCKRKNPPGAGYFFNILLELTGTGGGKSLLSELSDLNGDGLGG